MHIKGYTTLILSILLQVAIAQSNDAILDSLQNLLDNSTNPTERIELLVEMGDRSRFIRSLDDAFVYIDKAFLIATEIQDQKLIAKVSMEKGKLLAGKGNYDDAEAIFNEALAIYESVDDPKQVLTALNGLGIISRRKGNYTSAIHYLEKARTYFTDSVSFKNKGAVLMNLSNAYSRINQFTLATEKLFEALKYYENANFTHGLGLLYGNLGLLYKNQGNLDSAVVYLNKSLEIVENEGDLRGQLNAYNNLATVYSIKKDDQKALETSQKQLEIALKIGSNESVFFTKSNIADNYIALEQLKKAQTTLEEIDFFDKNNISKRHIFNYYLAYASLYHKLKNYPKGIEYAQQAYKIAKKQGDYVSLTSVLNALHTLYKDKRDFEKAYEYLEAYKIATDSLSNRTNLEELTAQKMQYEFDKTQETLNLEKEALENRLRTENITRWAAILVAILIAIIALISYRNAQKQNKLLSEDLKNKQKIEEQATQLRVFNAELEETVAKRTAELEQANYELKTFNYIASHDIKEPIRNIGNFAGFIQSKLPKQLQSDLDTYFQTIRKSTAQLYTLLEDFAKYTTFSSNKSFATHENVNLNEVIDSIENGLFTLLEEKNGKIINHGFPVIRSSSSMLYTALKHLIENGLKYNQATIPTIDISYKDNDQYHQITVSDNGNGIDEKYHQQIFEMFKRLHRREQYQGSGIGLSIVKLAVDKLDGEIELKSKIGEGATFIISLPKK